MDYGDSERGQELAQRAKELVDDVVLPTEREIQGKSQVSRETIETLREAARERDVYAPQISTEYGGMGESFRDALPVFEQAGRSLLAPAAMRVDAPDEGNMNTIEIAGTDEQKNRYLRPLVEGEIDSAFAMTEPPQGAGSDPKMIRTTAERDGDAWVIDGHKWWINNGHDADVLITLARTDQDAHPYEGCSLFLIPEDAEGLEVERDIPYVDDDLTGTIESELFYNDVRVPAENLLGAEGDGFAIAQKRLGPARLTHCMRYCGMASRALSVAKAYTSEREAFGSPIADKQGPRFDVAEAETRLHAARTMVRHAADQVASGRSARLEVSMCKLFTANVAEDVMDTSLQLCGANGLGQDLPVADFYKNVRKFRIVDGPDEVHKRQIARSAFEDVDADELANLPRYRSREERM